MLDKLPVVRDYMAGKLLTLRSDTEILDAVAFLVKHKISGAPVVDNDKHLLGVISEKDCLNLLAKGVDAMHAYHELSPAERILKHAQHFRDTHAKPALAEMRRKWDEWRRNH